MDIEKVKLYLKYPLLIPLDDSGSKYDGFLSIKGKDFRVAFSLPHFPLTQGMTFHMNPIVDECKSDISGLIKKPIMISEFLNNLSTILSSKIPEANMQTENINFIQFKTEEYLALMQNSQIVRGKPNKRLTKFKIKMQDEGFRSHYLIIENVDNLFKLTQHDIPQIDRSVELLKPNKKLTVLFDQFCGLIEKLQPYFDSIDSIDAMCWVLDPRNPARKDYSRRIQIDTNVSIQVTFDPWNMHMRPNIQFMGSERGVQKYRNSMIHNMENWDVDYDIVQGILRLLDLPFFPIEPLKDEYQKDEMSFETGECCICFCIRLNDVLPDQVCENPKCEQHFHTDCLYQWLSAISTNHQSSTSILGECPNCKTSISCPKPQ